VIFCTAHAEHAVAAFEDGALDYLLKPVSGPRLERALSRARSREQQQSFQELLQKLHAGPQAPERLAVPGRNGIQLLDPASVSHAVLEGELVTLVAGGGKHFTDLPLNDLEARLPKDRFVRVHRRALVNLHQVSRLEPAETGGFYAVMQSGDRVEVSRQAARELKRRLGIARASPGTDSDSQGDAE
jgi:two-component system LytT family response regulator